MLKLNAPTFQCPINITFANPARKPLNFPFFVFSIDNDITGQCYGGYGDNGEIFGIGTVGGGDMTCHRGRK